MKPNFAEGFERIEFQSGEETGLECNSCTQSCNCDTPCSCTCTCANCTTCNCTACACTSTCPTENDNKATVSTNSRVPIRDASYNGTYSTTYNGSSSMSGSYSVQTTIAGWNAQAWMTGG